MFVPGAFQELFYCFIPYTRIVATIRRARQMILLDERQDYNARRISFIGHI